MKVAIVVGTRPEIIKTAPIVAACRSRGVECSVVHTGQHYSFNMDRLFFEELRLDPVDRHLEVGKRSFGEQFGAMLRGVGRVLGETRPDVVVVQGDTNSVLAAGMAASRAGVPLAHVEAGLRSFDTSMAEELNRILTDHISRFLFAPTDTSRRNLLEEGLDDREIHVTGNTIVDAVERWIDEAEKRSRVLERLGLESGGYLLCTMHRPECVDHRDRFGRVVEALARLAAQGHRIVYPVHPRARRTLESFGLHTELAARAPSLRTIDPVGFLDFLCLEKHAAAVLTDSGGVQEETCVLRVPCVTLRENTERPETLEVGSNVLVGYEPAGVVSAVENALRSPRSWPNPYGDGRAAERIVEALLDAESRLSGGASRT